MNDNIEFSKQDDYLLATILDTVITTQRAQEILTAIGIECSNQSCNKILLDERTIEKREVSPDEIENLAEDIEKNKLNKVFMAFLCQPHLINLDSNLLSLYSEFNEFVIKYFTDTDKAVAWLNKQNS